MFLVTENIMPKVALEIYWSIPINNQLIIVPQIVTLRVHASPLNIIVLLGDVTRRGYAMKIHWWQKQTMKLLISRYKVLVCVTAFKKGLYFKITVTV